MVNRLIIGAEPEDVPTGINNVYPNDNVNHNEKIYNLNGQRVSKPTKGIFIRSGKKIAIK